MSASGAAEASVTHGRVLRIALPIVISNATVPLLGVVDTAVVGQMGTAAPIGAVGIGAIILSALYWLCLLYTSPSPRDRTRSRMPSSA